MLLEYVVDPLGNVLGGLVVGSSAWEMGVGPSAFGTRRRSRRIRGGHLAEQHERMLWQCAGVEIGHPADQSVVVGTEVNRAGVAKVLRPPRYWRVQCVVDLEHRSVPDETVKAVAQFGWQGVGR